MLIIVLVVIGEIVIDMKFEICIKISTGILTWNKSGLTTWYTTLPAKEVSKVSTRSLVGDFRYAVTDSEKEVKRYPSNWGIILNGTVIKQALFQVEKANSLETKVLVDVISKNGISHQLPIDQQDSIIKLLEKLQCLV